MNRATAIIARIETLTAPCREVDADIWLAVTPGATRKASVVKSSRGLWPDYTIDETRDASGRLIAVPHYTASLDAALTLVPAVHDTSLHIDNGEAIAGCLPASEDGCDVADSRGTTPAIALCIAAMKARAAIAEASS